MDAAKTFSKKTVLFLATALLLLVPGRALGAQFNLNSVVTTAVTVYPTPSNGASVYVNTDDGSIMTFNESVVTYTGTDPVWLNPTAVNGLNTPTTLYFSIGGYAGQLSAGTHTATVTLHDQAAVATDAVITISYTVGGSSGGGVITATPASAPSMSATPYSTTPSTALISLTTTSTSTISFTVTPVMLSGSGWLSAVPTAYSVSSTSSATLTITATAAALPTGTYTGSISIVPSGAAATSISVTFTVGTGGGNGLLTASPNPVSWSYTSGGTYPSTQVALASSTGALTYSDIVSSSNPWLNANYASSSAGQAISSGLMLTPGATFTTLATGSYTGAVYVTDANGNTVTITVNLVVNGGTSTGISWTPNPLTLTSAVSGSTQSQQVILTTATAGVVTVLVSSGSSWLSVSAVTPTTSTNTAYVTVYAVPGTLSASTYSGTLLVTVTPSVGTVVQQTVPVSFVVGSGGTITTAGIVTPTSLSFAYQTGTVVGASTLPGQSIIVTGSGFTYTTAVSYPSGGATGWIVVASGTLWAGNATSVNINPATLVPGTYTGTVTVTTSTGGSYNVAVSLLVTASPVLAAYPGTINFSYTSGGGNPSSGLYLYASDGSAMPLTVTTSATWLSVGSPTSSTTNSSVTVQGNNVASLANGVYTASVVVTATGAANSPVSVPVILTVSGSSVSGGSLTLSPSSMTFNAVLNGTAPATQSLAVSASTLTYYSASASSTGNWLTISPSGSLNTSSNPTITVSVNQSSLTQNTYYGTIYLTASGGAQQTVQVTLVVSSSTITGVTGNVTVTANGVAGTPSLTFTYQVGGSAPASQTLQVVSATGSGNIPFTISSSAAWLSAGVANGTSLNTPVNNPGFTISIVTPITLVAASVPYTATITITPNGGTVVTVPVSLAVQTAPTVSATPTTLSFSYTAGGANPATQTVGVSGGGLALAFTASVTSGSNWLSVSPASGTTPTTGTSPVTVTASPGTMGAGSYTGTILVAGSGTATGSTSINVTLAITAPLPTVTSVVNAASFIKGSISPGELITIFGTNIGPATAAPATIDPTTGKLATTIGGVQVLFAGTAAPMIYASSGQVSAVVPYEMAPVLNPSMWIKYVGQTSNAVSLTSATTNPGLFTQNSSGSGPGAILNQDNSLNGPGNPAAKGTIVQIYLTGEGQTAPAGVTGKITTVSTPPPGSNQVTPAPLLPVGVTINGLPALVVYAGEAPGLVAGVMQLNVQIPTNAQSGNLPIVVSIGPNISQTNVTVSVR